MKPIFLLSLLMGFLLFGGEWDTAVPRTTVGTSIEFNAAGATQFAVEQPIDLWQTYRYVDGLAGYMTIRVFQDREGILWFSDMYSFERLEKVIKQADTEISAEEMILQIVLDVKAHVGDAEQYDDMTIVVVRCLMRSLG
ncbi:TPA: hypothetical protein EYP66_19270 [Candidatus Poribacteria bacterium]|nr:hypothetical protein [Candidatus Poribacteria bacterium]